MVERDAERIGRMAKSRIFVKRRLCDRWETPVDASDARHLRCSRWMSVRLSPADRYGDDLYA